MLSLRTEFAQPFPAIAVLASALQEFLLALARAGDDLRTLANRVQVQQVILNLMPDTAIARRLVRRLRLDVHPYDNEWVEVRLSDTGPTVPPAVTSRMFLSFMTTDAAGHDLGVYVCRDIVDSHGVPWLDNYSPHGATIVVALPRMRGGPHG
ncbi:ATP-binding protein [Paracoccus actinidiae]|uniref:ATP-binding protein n=1 Tax=Paracoccus actinidiae TaxID=3064531 RepID=UPI0027D30CEF|nr:ATP-binding protein [Paracoccus sp. M09]